MISISGQSYVVGNLTLSKTSSVVWQEGVYLDYLPAGHVNGA